MAEEVKLIGTWSSLYSRRVEIALKMKGIPYEFIEEDLSNKSPLLLTHNPIQKKVPVLLYNGKPIVESLIILEFIDETWEDNPILPKDPYERAKARFWARYLDEKCLAPLWIANMGVEKDRPKAMEEALECLKTLEGELGDKRFFGGDTIGFVDIAANFVGYWLLAIQEISGVELLTPEKFPVLFKWTEEFYCYSIIKENLPPRDKLVSALARFQTAK